MKARNLVDLDEIKSPNFARFVECCPPMTVHVHTNDCFKGHYEDHNILTFVCMACGRYSYNF